MLDSHLAISIGAYVWNGSNRSDEVMKRLLLYSAYAVSRVSLRGEAMVTSWAERYSGLLCISIVFIQCNVDQVDD